MLEEREHQAFRRDEWLEEREVALSRKRDALGRRVDELNRELRSLPGRYLPHREKRRERARKTLELFEALGRLAEVREVRRGLLGKAPNAHIRPREVPTFVREQQT